MFSKIKDIKKKIKIAKIAAIVLAIVFVLHLILSGYMFFEILELKEQL